MGGDAGTSCDSYGVVDTSMMVAAKRSIAEATRPGRFAAAQEDDTLRDSAWVTRDGRQHINNKQEQELRDLKEFEEHST